MWCLQKADQFLCLVFFFLNFQANLSLLSSATQLCYSREASALIQFKSSFSINKDCSWLCNYNAIEFHPKTDSWHEGTDCCTWDGVTCDDIKGHVIGLDLNCSWLCGHIPSNSSLFHLQHLRKLNLAFNDFDSSELSSRFGELTNLVYLNLSQSNFAGKIPSQVSRLSKLVSLDLSTCPFYNEIIFDEHTFEELVHNLTGMRHLFLNEIAMLITNPNVLMNLSSSLRSLSLYNCGLQGKFPENFLHLPNLKIFDIGANSLNLSLPKFNRSSHLKVLDLSYTSLSTKLINSISNLASLEYLDVSNPSFPVGELSEPIGNLISLKHLDLQKAHISGSIPEALGNLSKLNYLDLSINFLSGKIPSSLVRKLSQLQFLSLEDNQLEGSVPDEVSAFPNLTDLYLSFNLLNGTLPSWLYTIPSLKQIILLENQFSGHFKEFQYDSVESICLQNNKLQGPIPSSISQFVNLTALYLTSNNLSGIVEIGMFSKLQNLEALDLSFNSLSLNSDGTSADFTLPNLADLDLSSCNVSKFPLFLRDSKSLRYLDLSNNRIYGKIPKWMRNVGKNSFYYLNLSHNSFTNIDYLPRKQIKILDLSSNLIHGDLPILPLATHAFLISNNSLSGEISSLICNVSSLGLLDLSHNNLSGFIPRCFGNLSKSLWMLNLRMNKFHGIIPRTFTKGCQLENLNLNGNQLEGPLTRSILRCKGLEVLDIGNNKIKDTFPHWLATLPKLQVLVLRSNQLHGSIHYDTRSTISFPKIQIFDLSSNYFTGTLPVRYIKNFKSMINLTFNGSAMPYLGSTGHDGEEIGFYSFSIGIAIKGLDMELEKIFTMLTTIDLSNNKFQGEIPKVIGKLSSLKGLNLSHNNLTGSIPSSLGNLNGLEWLDLSSNKLIGTIPERLLDVPWLSFLNLSKNQLVGCIPEGKQFNTFENSSYEGNEGLRGFPLSKDCNENRTPQSTQSNSSEEDGSKLNIAFGWEVVLIGYGCGVVFGLAMGYVVFRTGKPKWFVTLVEDRHNKRRKMPRIGDHNGGERRI